MAVDDRRRHDLYEYAKESWSEEAAETLTSSMPPFDWSEVVTKRDLAASAGELRAEMAVLRAELRAEMSDLRAEMHDLFRRQTRWVTAAVLGGMSVAAAVARLG